VQDVRLPVRLDCCQLVAMRSIRYVTQQS
jgi:hypothetical protein